MTPGTSATAIPSSTRPIGITHTGQPGRGPARRFRQQVVHPVPIDGVSMSAADLRHLVPAVALDHGTDLRRQSALQIGVAIFVDEFHAATSARTDPPKVAGAQPPHARATRRPVLPEPRDGLHFDRHCIFAAESGSELFASDHGKRVGSLRTIPTFLGCQPALRATSEEQRSHAALLGILAPRSRGTRIALVGRRQAAFKLIGPRIGQRQSLWFGREALTT